MKTLFSLILLLIVVLGSAAQNSVHAENDDPCKNPNDKTWCAIKSIANEAKDLSDYYDTAKNAIEIGTQLGMALGWIAKHDPIDDLYKRVQDDLTNLAEGIDWTETMNFIAMYHPDAATAIAALAANKTNALKDTHYPTWSEEGPSVFAEYQYTIAPFYRPYNSKTALWSKAFFDYTLDKKPGNKVYDWRLGIPPFLQMISWRIQWIAAMYPYFRITGERDFELKRYSEALQFHYDKMLNGVRCSRWSRAVDGLSPVNKNWWMCGDIYSGLAIYAHHVLSSDDREYPEQFDYPDPRDGVWGCTESEFVFFDCAEPDKNIPLDRDKYIWVAPATVNQDGIVTNDDEILAELKSLVMRRMPLFEMKAMINTLNLYRQRSIDLTEKFRWCPSVTLIDRFRLRK